VLQMCKGWCSAAGVAAGAGAAVGVSAAHGKQKQVYSRRVRRKHKGQPKLKMQYRVKKNQLVYDRRIHRV
jgi:hypothetical protein